MLYSDFNELFPVRCVSPFFSNCRTSLFYHIQCGIYRVFRVHHHADAKISSQTLKCTHPRGGTAARESGRGTPLFPPHGARDSHQRPLTRCLHSITGYLAAVGPSDVFTVPYKRGMRDIEMRPRKCGLFCSHSCSAEAVLPTRPTYPTSPPLSFTPFMNGHLVL